MRTPSTLLHLFFGLTLLLFIQTFCVFSVSAQACDQVEILYTEPDCYKKKGSNGSPGDQKACKEIAACEGQPYEYISSIASPGTFLWTATGPAAVVFNPNNTSNFTNIVWTLPGIYTLTLTYTDLAANVSTACLSINVKEKPVANFTFAPNNLCAGSTVGFSNTSTFTNGSMAYSWNFGDPSSSDNTSDQTNPSHLFSTPGTYTVCLIASSFVNQIVPPLQGTQHESSTIVTCCSDTLCKQVVIVPGSIKIECVSTVCAGAIQTYTSDCANTVWSAPIGGSILSSTLTEITIQWGNGNVQGQILASCPGGCLTSIPVPIIPSNPIPIGNQVPCLDALTSYNLPILPGTFYNWSLININTSTIHTPSLYTQPDNNTVWINWANILPNGTDDYLLTINLKNEHICCNTVGSVVIKPRREFTGFFNQTICLNGAASLSVFPTAGTFNWAVAPTTGVTPISGPGAIFSPTFANTGTYIATVTETANTYCNSPIPQSFNVEVLTATPAPSNITGPANVCLNSIVSYAMSTPAPSGYYYTWTITAGIGTFEPGALTTVTGDVANINWTALGGTISVVLERTTFPTCPSPIVTYNVAAVTVTGNITGPLNVCVDGSQTYTITGGNLPPGEPVTWSITPASLGTITAGQGTSSATILWHGGVGAGPWVATSIQGTTACGAVTSLLNITIYPKFTFTLSQTGDICDIGPPAGAQLTASAVANSPTYLWSPSGAITNPSYTTTSGFNFLTVTNAGGCTYTDKILVADPFKLATNCAVSTCNGVGLEKALLVQVAAPGSGTFTYNWYSGVYPSGTLVAGPIVTGATSNIFTATADGSYFVTVQYKGCIRHIQYFVEKVCCPDINNPIITNVTQLNCFDYSFTGTANPTGATLTWDLGDGSPLVTGTSGVPILHTYTTAGVYCVKFCAGPPNINPTSCIGNCTLTSVTVPLNASFSTSLSCAGCLTVSNTSVRLGPSGFFTYLWNYGDPTSGAANTSTLESPPPHCFAGGAGTYSVSLTVTYNNGAGIICSDIYTQNILYTPLSMLVTPLPVCTGNTVSFSSNPAIFNTYTWAFGDGTFAYTPNSTHIYNATNPANTIQLSVVDFQGNVCTTSITGAILAGSTCTISPGYICPGGSATLTAPAGVAYLWEEFVLGNWIAASGTNNVSTYSTSTPGIFRVKVTNANGCICTSNSVPVINVAKPIAKIAVIPSKKLCAPGGLITLKSVNHIGADISQWYAGSILPINELPGSPASTLSTFVAATTTFFLVHTNQYGCQDICQIIVEVNPNPPIPVITSAPIFPVCEGTVYTLTATPGSPTNTTWNTGQIGNIITTSAAGGYIATNTNLNTGCSSSSAIFVINKKPSVLLYPHYCDDILCECHNPMNPFAIYAPRPLIGFFAPSYNVAWFNSPSGTPIIGPPITNGGLDYTNLPTGVLSGAYYITMTDPATSCTSTSPTYKVTVPTFEDCANCTCKGSSWGPITLTTVKPPITTTTILCGEAQTISCSGSYTLNATYNCLPTGCSSDVTFVITGPGGPYTGSLPFTFTPSSGTYTVSLTGYCNGVACSENLCEIRFIACPPLDVNLISFIGQKIRKTVELYWETASEKGNDFYVIERSDDGQKFNELGKILSKNTNSLEKLTYNYVDLFPNLGLNYYRLKAIDLDGKNSLSRVIAVDFEEVYLPKIYPNPSKTDIVSIEIPIDQSGKIKLEWFDMLGRVLKINNLTGIKGQNKFEINVTDLPSGKYLIKINKENEIGIGSVLSFER